MKSSLLLLTCLLWSAPALCGQTVTDTNNGVCLSADGGTGAFTLSWYGRHNRVYFPEGSEELVTWTPLPVYEVGLGAVLTYGLSTNAPRYFLRLRYSDDPDYDHDGLSNLEELALETSPTGADSDGDGIPDGWERAHGLDPRNSNDAAAFPPGGNQTYLTLFLAEKGLLDRCAAATLPSGMQLVLRTSANGFRGVKPTGEIATVPAP